MKMTIKFPADEGPEGLPALFVWDPDDGELTLKLSDGRWYRWRGQEVRDLSAFLRACLKTERWN